MEGVHVIPYMKMILKVSLLTFLYCTDFFLDLNFAELSTTGIIEHEESFEPVLVVILAMSLFFLLLLLLLLFLLFLLYTTLGEGDDTPNCLVM